MKLFPQSNIIFKMQKIIRYLAAVRYQEENVAFMVSDTTIVYHHPLLYFREKIHISVFVTQNEKVGINTL